MSFDDRVRGDVIQQLMCYGKIDIGAIERRHGIDFLSYFTDALRQIHPLVSDRLVTVVGNVIAATPRGRLLMRVIAMCFDRYLRPQTDAGELARFSKVV